MEQRDPLILMSKYGHYKNAYTYGLNWANEFMKTMMQQVYKKGQVIETWNKKIVFVIQDVALEYLENAVKKGREDGAIK